MTTKNELEVTRRWDWTRFKKFLKLDAVSKTVECDVTACVDTPIAKIIDIT